MFYVDRELEGQKCFLGRDFLSKNLLGKGYRKQTASLGLIGKQAFFLPLWLPFSSLGRPACPWLWGPPEACSPEWA